MKPALVVLAAGLGSRYGSLKQIDQFGPNGETIIDYSIYDAIKAGFGKVVFVIRQNIEAEFKEVFYGKFSDKVDIDYVLQEIDKIPANVKAPEGREKPWGTGHAVMLALEKIHEPFGVINADDFYGASAIKMLHDQLASFEVTTVKACLIAYQLSNTLSDFGHVSRGICTINDRHILTDVVEHTHIIKRGEDVYFIDEKNERHPLTGKELISMNLMGFTPTVLDFFIRGFQKFLSNPSYDHKKEFYLPTALNDIASSTTNTVHVLETSEKWFGVTYREDKPIAEKKLKKLVETGKYPSPLWKVIKKV